MNPPENDGPENPADEARKEEKLVALYMELTGCGAAMARSVYAYVEPDNDES